MIEDCGGSIKVRSMRIKKDREEATNEDENEYRWIQFPNGIFNNHSHWLYINLVSENARRENVMYLHSVRIQCKP
jgi:hypothetical protein